MTRECGATAYLPPALAVRAAEHLTGIGVGEPAVEHWLQCFLEAHAEGSHYGLVSDTLRGVPDVWATWSGADRPADLTHLAACPRDNGKEGGLQDVCSLFVRHPGRCTFELTSPDAQAVSRVGRT